MKRIMKLLTAVCGLTLTTSLMAANVARIGGTEYATIDNAVKAIVDKVEADGATIELLSDVSINGYIARVANFTLEGNGHTITCTQAHSSDSGWRYLVNVSGGSKQTFRNVTLDANGKVPWAVQCIGSTSELTLDNVTLKNATTTTKTLEDGDKATSQGYGLHINGGKVVANNIKVYNSSICSVYLDGNSSNGKSPSFTLTGDDCDFDVVGSSESVSPVLTSTAKGFYAYYVEAKYKWLFLTPTKKVNVISALPWNDVIEKVGDFGDITVRSATVKLLQDVTLSEAFTSANSNLTIDGNGKTFIGTIKFTSSPSAIKNMVLGEGATLDCTGSEAGGLNVFVADNTNINILLPASTDINAYKLPVTLSADATATISVGDVKYIAKNGVIAPAETVAQIGDTQYTTLQDAINAAASGATIHVLKDVALTASLNVASDKNLTLNLAGRKITVSGANYSLVNNGTLTIIDMAALVSLVSETAAQDDEVVTPIVIAGVSANDGVMALTEGGSIAGVQNNGTLAVESGTIETTSASVVAIDNTASGTTSITGGSVQGTVASVSTDSVTITGGTFSSDISDYLDESYGVDENGSVVSYAAKIGETKYETLEAAFGAANEYDVVTVLDDTADVSEIAGYVTEGFFPISNGDKTYTVRAVPTATVKKLPAFTLTAARDAYRELDEFSELVYGTEDKPLDIVMDFSANDDGKAEANATGFADWACDFYLTFSGLKSDTVTSDKCYLAGNYGDYGWIVLGGESEFSNNETFSIVTSYKADDEITYRQICDQVKKFTAAIYMDDEVLTANPDIEITLELKMTNDKDSGQELVVGSYTYTIDDLNRVNNPEVDVAEGVTVEEAFKTTVADGLANAYHETEGKLAITVKTKGETFSTIDVSATDYTLPAEGLEMTFPAEAVANGETAFIVHKHGDKQYVHTAVAEYGFVTYNNTLGFSDFTVGDESALNAALAAGGEIVLSSDIELASMLTVPEGVTVTLDLNGYAITVPEAASGANHIYALNNKGVMTIKDTSTEGTGSISARGIYNGWNGSNDIDAAVDGAKMIIEGGNFFGLDTNGGAAIFNCAELIIEDGAFDGKTAAVNNRTAGVATINGGTFSGGLALGIGYAIQNRGEMTINNATVNAGFGAVGAYGGKTVIEDGSFLPTGMASKTCHVVYVESNADVTINGGTFKMNYSADAAPDSGHAVASLYNSKLSITGGTFISLFGKDQTDDINWSPVQLSEGSIITGGTFLTAANEVANHPYVTDYLGGGYSLNESGTVEFSAVAKIGEVYYSSITNAIAEAEADDTVIIFDPEVAVNEANIVAKTGGKEVSGQKATEAVKVLGVGGAFKVVAKDSVKTLVYDYDLGVQAVTFSADKFVMTIGLTEGDAKVTREFTDRWVVVSVGETEVASCELKEIVNGSATVELPQDTILDPTAPASGSTTKRISFAIVDEEPTL